MMNKEYAILVAVPATPDKPSTPAMMAMTRNVTAQLSITYLLVSWFTCPLLWQPVRIFLFTREAERLDVVFHLCV